MSFPDEVSTTEKFAYRMADRMRRSPSALLAALKRRLVAKNSRSHNVGMVGFIKELVDQCAVEDIFHPEFGKKGSAVSLIKELRIQRSHALVIRR